jgi:hypothetical protein
MASGEYQSTPKHGNISIVLGLSLEMSRNLRLGLGTDGVNPFRL